MIALGVGQPYPLPVPSEGAMADFLGPSNRLLVCIPDPTNAEIKALKKGCMACGLLSKNGAILLIWQFGDKKGRPVLTLDSPFDARLVRDIQLHNIESPHSRLVIEVHIVDGSSLLVKGLRAVTMSPELSLAFLAAVQDQLASSFSGTAQHDQWALKSPPELLLQSTIHKMGEA